MSYRDDLAALFKRAHWWRILMAAVAASVFCWLIGLPSFEEHPGAEHAGVLTPPIPRPADSAAQSGHSSTEPPKSAIKPSHPLDPDTKPDSDDFGKAKTGE